MHLDELHRHESDINELLAHNGVKFGIYKNGHFRDQLFPFDTIPRINAKDDFAHTPHSTDNTLLLPRLSSRKKVSVRTIRISCLRYADTSIFLHDMLQECF